MLDKPIMTKIEPIEIERDNEDMVNGDNTVEITNIVQQFQNIFLVKLNLLNSNLLILMSGQK